MPKKARRTVAAMLLGGTTFQIVGFIEKCDERLITASTYFDPCGTFLANCAPGDIQTNNADVGDYCIDPTCTIPGQCGTGQALGTITDLCP